MSTENITPLQHAIATVKAHIGGDNSESDYTLKVIVHHLESLLPKEKDFINTVWGAAIKRTWAEYRSDTSSDTPDNQQFINQLYPEK